MQVAQVNINRGEGATVVEIAGELDASNLADASKHVDAAMTATAPRLVVDLAKLSFIDSAAVGWLARLHARMVGKSGAVVLVAGGFVLKVFTTLGVERMIPIRGSVAEALEHLHAPRAGALDAGGAAAAARGADAPRSPPPPR